jgi:hypothetical protein
MSGSLLFALSLLALGPEVVMPTDPGELYSKACALCHGAAGEGLAVDHPSYASFDPPPADLSDPLFNSREPAADWFLVTKYGGKRLGLSSQMPAYGEAFDDEQIHAVVGYMKTLADTRGYPPGELNFTRANRTIKPFPEDEAILVSRYDEGPDSVGHKHVAYYGFRFRKRLQGEVKLTQSRRSGVDDNEEEVEVGVKWAFHDNLERSLLLATGLEVEIPLDEGNEVWIPYLGWAQGLGDSFTLQSTLRSHLPADDLGKGDAEVSAVVHWLPGQFARTPVPGLELVSVVPFESERSVAWSVMPQLYFGLTKGGHVALNVGAEIPLGGHPWDYRVQAFLLWDFADGPFWRGW